jgi:MFS family permease
MRDFILDNMEDLNLAGPSGAPGAGDGALRQRRLILAMAITANLFGNLNFSGINVAAPAIERELGLSAAEIGWLTLSCMLLMAAVSAPVARISDILGRRRLTLFGLYVTVLGFAGSAVSASPFMLFAFRALTGVGLSTFFTTAMTMVTAAFPKEERGRVLGLTIGSVYISLSIGPVLSGLLLESLGWRSLFVFWLIILIPTIILAHLVDKEEPVTPDERLEWRAIPTWALGTVLFFTGFASVTSPMRGLAILGMAVGAFLIGVFVWQGRRSASPLLDLGLFTGSRRFTFSSLAAFISYMSSFCIALLLSLYFQYSKGFSALSTGMILVTQPLVQAALTPISGRLSDRHDPGKIASLGLGVILLGILIFVFFLDPGTPIWLILLAMGLSGAGFALFSAPNSNAIMSSVPPLRLGQASGVITITRLTGQISSMALATLVFAQVIGPGEITPDRYPSFIRAARILFSIFAPLCFLAIFASLARGKARKTD